MNIPQQLELKRTQRNDHKRYRYCCRKCKHTEKGKKSCVCVVPMSQRRTTIGDIGCQTCGCKGCSVQDYIHRGEDPQYRPQRYERSRSRSRSKDRERELCCKKCSKKYSKTRKACVCNLPRYKRKGKVPIDGCKVCGCDGCNDKQYSDDSYSSRSRSQSKESSLSQNYDEYQYNFNNVDKSMLGKVIAVQYNLNPALMGLGIPQRTPSYILGKPL